MDRGHEVQLDVAPHRFQYAPWLTGLRPPASADVTLANSWNAAAFSGSTPLVTVVHHVVHEPAFAPYKSFGQTMFHRAFVRPMEMRALRVSKAIIAVSATTAAAIRANLADVPVDVVLNGIDTEFFRPLPRGPQRDPTAPIELLFVGKPSRRKGFDLLANVVNRLGDACRLTCIGEPPGQGLPKPPGRYLGRVSNESLRSAYQQADLLLFPSRLEGFGYAAAEALACGLPVVCSQGGAVAEIVPELKCGIVCSSDEPTAFVEAIRAVARNPEQLNSMREHARAHACAKLDARRWIRETEAVLARAAAVLPAQSIEEPGAKAAGEPP